MNAILNTKYAGRDIKFYESRIAYFRRCLADPGCIGFRPMCREAIAYCRIRIWQLVSMN